MNLDNFNMYMMLFFILLTLITPFIKAILYIENEEQYDSFFWKIAITMFLVNLVSSIMYRTTLYISPLIVWGLVFIFEYFDIDLFKK